MTPRSLRVFALAALIVVLAVAANGQIGNLTDTTSVPITRAGHDYIQAKLPADKRVFGGTVTEIVNPASGQVSIRIGVTTPAGRQLSLPFAFAYDSEGVHHLESTTPGNLVWESNFSYLAQSGWAYDLPMISEVERLDVNGSYRCDYATDFMFQDSQAERHALYISYAGYDEAAPSNSCQYTSPQRQNVTTGGEGPILAVSQTIPSGVAFSEVPITVTDADGTQYIFQNPNRESGVNGFDAELPDTIEDRNGNEIAITDSGGGRFSVTDTAGRTLLSSSGFGASGNTLAVSGESSPYTVNWGTVLANYSISANVESGSCSPPTSIYVNEPVITSIALPNGGQFQFAYDATYGLLQKITLPTGGYIRYVWGLNAQSEEGTFDAASGTCSVRYDQPVVTDRYVSLDGSTEVLHQSFAYATNWGSGSMWSTKQTTATNYDLARGPSTSFQTIYTYSGYYVPWQPNDDTASTLEIPVEQTVVHDDWSGATLRTIAETWSNPRVLATKTTTENDGEKSEQTMDYDGNEQMLDKYEYSYGSGAVGSLARHTVMAYACASSVHVVDRPTKVQIEDGSSKIFAETDYAYDQSALQPSGASDGRDPAYAYSGSITARCNPTTVTKVNSTGNITEQFSYDDAGNALTHTDGNGNTTSYAYGSAYQAAYPTEITLPNTTTGGKSVQHSTALAYNLASGLLASRTDQQNQTTTNYAYNDSLDRLTEVDYPDGGQTLFVFAANSIETERLQQQGKNSYTQHFDHWDGLGNADRTLTYNGSNWDTVDTAFDGEQLPMYQSYAYFSTGIGSAKATSNSAEPGDTTTFDGLGRPTQVVRSDNAVFTTAYSGPDVTTTDEAGSKKELFYDALGRLSTVWQYYDSKGDWYSTYYTYDPLDDMTYFSLGNEMRTYTFDNLKRMLTAANPESGTASYVYDNDGNLTKKQEANGTIITYGYDALNRLRSRTYSVSGATAQTPSVQIDYDVDSTGATTTDAYGRMTRAIAGTTSLGMDTYDPMGRLKTLDTVLGGTDYSASVSYDLTGAVSSETYPSGRVVNTALDADERPSTITDQGSSYNFLLNRTYYANRTPYNEQFGNGLVEHVAFNQRNQPSEITVKNPNDATNNTWRMDLSVGYTASGVQSADNGNVVRLVDNLGNTGQAYSLYYDQLNRLARWTTDAGKSCPFGADEYGNLADQSQGGCGMIGGLSFNTNNQIVGYSYDSSGNLLSDTSGTSYGYDGNDELVGFSVPGESGSYVYDALLGRVSKTAGTATTLYLRDPLGRVASTLSSGTYTDEIWAEGERVAEVVGGGVSTVHFFHADQVGTTRAVTDANGNNLASCAQNATYPNGSFLTYSPFGTPMDCTQSATAYKFTSKEQDAESSLDHFRYRKYSALQARWLTPDPAGLGAACAKNPQSLNPYGYALSSPAKNVDINGLFLPSCSPEGSDYELEGIDLPPCPWVFVPLFIPFVQVTPGCTCRSINAVPVMLWVDGVMQIACSYECTCPGGGEGTAAWGVQAMNEECGPLRGYCPRFAQATRTVIHLFLVNVEFWKLTGCIR